MLGHVEEEDERRESCDPSPNMGHFPVSSAAGRGGCATGLGKFRFRDLGN